MIRLNHAGGIAVCAMLLIVSPVAMAAVFTSAQSGNWNDGPTWGGSVPGVGDTVTITSNHVVSVTDARVVQSVVLDSTAGNKMLVIDTGGSLLVELAAGAAVTINAPSPGSTNIVRLNGGTLETSNSGISITGASSASKLEFTSLGGTATLFGNVAFSGTAANAQIDFGPSGGLVEIGGDLGSGGTLINNTSSLVSINGAGAQTINGYTFNDLTVNKSGGTATLNAAITVNGDLNVSSGVLDDGGNQISLNGSGTSNVAIGSTGVLKLGAGAMTTFFPTPLGTSTMSPGSAVVYQSGLQQAINSDVLYDRLYLATLGGPVTHITTGAFLFVNTQLDITDNGPNTVTLDLGTGTLDLNGDLTGDGTLSMTSGSMTIAGSFSSVASLNAGTGTVTYDGTGAQQVLGGTYHHLVINKSSGTATPSGNTTVNGDLTVSAGTFDTSTATLSLNGSGSIAGSVIVNGALALDGGAVTVTGSLFIDVLASVTRTTGWIIGPLQMGMNATPARTFHVGTAASYLPVDVDSASAGTLTIAAVEGKSPDRTADNVLERFWTVPAGSITSIDSITFNYNLPDVVTGDETKYVLAHYDSGSLTFTLYGPVNNVTHSVTEAIVATYVGDWIIGQPGSLGAASQLAIISINGGTDPQAATAFDVVVEAQDDDGDPTPVVDPTGITLSVAVGSGTLGGTTTGTIGGGADSTTISGVTYSPDENGVQLTATRTSGDILDSGTSAAFNVLAVPSTLTVTSINDSGAGTLREAITTANGGGCTTPCTIDFSTSGAILLASALPAITLSDLTIDGISAPGASANTNAFGLPSNAIITLELNGGNTVPFGFEVQSSNVLISGFAIRNFANAGVRFTGANNGSKVIGSQIGTDATGLVAAANAGGVLFDGSAGASAGGMLPAERNIISGNTFWGITINATSSTISVTGNYIGPRRDLAGALPNVDGIVVQNGASAVAIGTASLGNVVSGNSATGIILSGSNATVAANLIGTAGNSVAAIPNSTGLYLNATASSNTIGGPSPSDVNVISGNSQNGVLIEGDDNTIDNNLLGIAPDGTTSLGNAGSGVRLEGTASNNRIGTTFGNKIAYNVNDGVSVATTGGIGNVIRRGKIAGNGNRAIDLGDNGTTANDATDADTGPNNLQNFPIIDAASYNAGNVDVLLSLDSSAGVNVNFVIFDVYRADASSPAQALEYLGNSGCLAGNLFTSTPFSVPAGTVVVGNNVVATATAYSDAACGTPSEGTSELSPGVRVGGDIHWITGSGNWESAANWSPAVVPTSADDAYIDATGTYTVTINTIASVKSVHVGAGSGTQTLAIPTSQSLTFTSASTVSPNGALAFSGLSFGGAGHLAVDGVLTWSSGDITGAGGITINSGGTLNVDTPSSKSLNTSTITIANGATANWTGGTINLVAGGGFDNFGTFEVMTDAAFADGGTPGTFDNAGTFRKTVTAGTTAFLNIALTHTAGTIDLQTGTLNRSGVSVSAPIAISSGALLLIDNAIVTLGAGSDVTGAGLIQVAGGTLTVNTSDVLPNVQLDAGSTINGTATVDITVLLWNGGTMSGTGTTNIPSGGAATLASSSGKDLQRTFSIAAGATTTVTGFGIISLSSGGNIANAGLFDCATDGTITDAGGDAGFLNTGTFRKSGGAGSTAIANVDFTNNGTIEIQTGTFNPGNVTSAGTIDLTGNFLVNDGIVMLNAGTDVLGSGLLLINGGTVTANTADTIPNVQLDSGALNGTAIVSIDALTWNGGTMAGSGTTTIPAAGTAAIATAAGKDLQRTFTVVNGGIVNVTGSGAISLSSGGNITNDGLINITTAMNFSDSGGAGDIVNTRTFRVNHVGTTTLSLITLNNSTASGQIDILNGTLDLADGASSAAIAIASGSSLLVNSDTYTFAAGTTVTGAGTVSLSAGTLNVTGNVSVPGFAQTGGTLDGAGTLTLTNVADWSTGTMQGGGITEVSATGTLNLLSPSAKSLNNRTLSSIGGATINLSGNGPVNLSNGANIANGGLILTTADNIFSDSLLAGDIVNTGTIRKQTATGTTNLTGVGLINNGGLIDIQSGTISVADTFTQNAGSTLKIWLGGTTPGTGFGQLSSSNSVNLAGTLEVALVGPYQPIGGDTFRVISAPGNTGDFTQPYTYPVLANSRTFSDAYDASGLLLTVNGNADLSISKTAPSNVLAGDPIAYTLTVNDAGPDAATSVSVTDVLEAGHTVITASGTGWTCNVNILTVTCTAATLAVGTAPAITINANAPATPQTFTNVANVSSSNDSVPGNNSGSAVVTVDPLQADLAVSATGPVAPLAAGVPFQFDYAIQNAGPQTATNVAFTAIVPPTLVYNSATPDAGTCNFAAGTISCSVGSILSGATLNVVVSLDTSTSGTHTVTGSATATESDPVPGNNSSSASVQVTGSTLTVVNTNNSGPGSLRQAILDANGGVCTPLPCGIAFNIPAGPYVIAPLSNLPALAGQIVLDATTQPGYAGVPVVEIDGSSPTTGIALSIAGDNSAIRGFSIHNETYGIDITGNSNAVEANYIGLTPAGAAAPNSNGVRVFGNNNVIGGTTAAQRNVISGNTSAGVILTNTASGNIISGNYIGTDPTGTTVRANTTGIEIFDDSDANTIGGSTTAHRNVISGNSSSGVFVDGFGPVTADGTIIRNNWIGLDATGTATLAAGTAGVLLSNFATGTQISENTITGQATGLALLGGTTGTSVLSNSIHDNTLLGIDLSGDGITTNDAGDGDTGPNGLQNTPVVNSVSLTGGGNVHIAYSVDSSATAAGSMRVELFEADAGGEGKILLGTACVAGNAFTTGTPFSAPGLSAGDPVVATATSYSDAGCTTVTDGTSEFSSAVTAANCTPPAVTITGATAMCAGGGPVVLDAGPGFASYLWSNGATTQTITVSPASTATFTVTVSDTIGCTNSDTHTVTVNPLPVVTITGPASTCASAPVTLDAGAGFPGYAWSNGATTQTITVSPNTTTTYTVTVTDGNTCQGSDSHTVTVTTNPTATVTAPSSVCESSAGNNASVVAQAGAAYNWTIGGGTITAGQSTNAITFTAGPSGTVTLGVTVTANGCTSTGNANVTISALPAVTITGPATACSGSTVTLDAGPGFASYLWSTGATTQTIILAAAVTQTYSVTVTTGAGCSATDSHTVNVTPAPSALITAPSEADPEEAGLVASVSVQPGATYAWSVTNGTINSGNGTDSIVFTAGASGLTELDVVVTLGGCSTSGSHAIFIDGVQQPSEADLGVTKSAEASVQSGAAITYTIGIRNFGPGAATGVIITDTLPAGTTFVAMNPGPWNCTRAGATINCTGNAPLGTNSVITISVRAPSLAGVITNTVQITSSTADPDAGNNFASAATTVTGSPASCENRAAATPFQPVNNAMLTSSDVLLQWNHIEGADGYRVFASIDGAPPALTGTTGDNSLRVTLPAAEVVWFVQTLYQGCGAVESARSRFTIPAGETCSGPVPSLLMPSDGSTTNNAEVTFAWTAIPGALAYEVWLSLENASPTLVGQTSGTSFTYLIPAGTVDWSVRAIVDRCQPRMSSTARATYAPPAQCADNRHPIPISPLNGSITSAPLTFEWHRPAGAFLFDLFAVQNGNAPSLVASTSQTQVSGVALPQGVQHWFVRAHFANGCSSLESPEQQLEIVAAPPACTVPGTPQIAVPGQISTGVPFLIQWTPVTGATGYQLELAADGTFAGSEIVNTTLPLHQLLKTNEGQTPLALFARVRAIDARCPQPAIGPFGSSTAVFILPQSEDALSLPLTGGPATLPLTLGPELAGQSFTAVPQQPWLTVSPSSGVVAAEGTTLIVFVDTATLAPGSIRGGVVVALESLSAGSVQTNNTTTVTSGFSVSLVTPVAPGASDTPPPDAMIIPAVAHADGINSQFQSDVRLSNTSARLINYQLTFKPSGASFRDTLQTTFAVEPGRTIALDDILRTWFGVVTSDAVGTLEIRPLTETTSPIGSGLSGGLASLVSFASSRTFNVTANGTYGQYIPAIPFSSFIGQAAGGAVNRVLSLQQIAQSSRYRTNLGLVEGSGEPAELIVRIFGESGQYLTEFNVNLRGGQHLQLDAFLRDQGITSLNDGRVEVQVASGGGKVTAYASVLDNETDDPLLVTPVPVEESGATKWVVPGVADLVTSFANWQTDMRLFNAGTEAVEATLSFYPEGTGTAKTATVTIPAGQVRQFDKTLSSLFNTTNQGGAIHIATRSAARLIATARTYNQTGAGTYGQFIQAITETQAAGLGSRPLQLLQIEESERFRSNVGLVEVGGSAARIEITVVPPDAKFTAVTELTLQPNEFRQLGSLLRSMGLQDTHNARVTVRVIEGAGRVGAYASVIDMQTNDPTYVPAQ